MNAPPNLKKGDKIGIVAPARMISKEEISFAEDTIRGWGLEIIHGVHLFGKEHQFSGSDDARAEDFQNMLDNDSIKAIFCARGGYGSLRIIDKLNFSQFVKHPKWIVGYSDVTVFHSHIHQKFGIQTLHATMPINFNKDAGSLESLRSVLFGNNPQYSYASHLLNRTGNATGELVGGNLSLLYALQCSESDIHTEGKILFIEDLDEYLYHLDRMMRSLKRSGKLENLAGLIVGSMSDMRDNTVPFGKAAEEIVAESVAEYSFPVSFGFPAGHGTKNLALPLGRKAKYEVAGACSLSF